MPVPVWRDLPTLRAGGAMMARARAVGSRAEDVGASRRRAGRATVTGGRSEILSERRVGGRRVVRGLQTDRL